MWKRRGPASRQGRQACTASHGQPEDKRVTELQKVLNALQVGAVFSEKPTPREFRQLVERLSARPDGLLPRAW